MSSRGKESPCRLMQELLDLWVVQLTPPTSDFPNKIGTWLPPAETVLVVSHLSGSGATPNPLRCSCILRHRRLAPTIVTVAVVITSKLIAAIRIAVPSCCQDSHWYHFFQRPTVLWPASETQPIRSLFARSEWVCVL
jgi:hypothetical protein